MGCFGKEEHKLPKKVMQVQKHKLDRGLSFTLGQFSVFISVFINVLDEGQK